MFDDRSSMENLERAAVLALVSCAGKAWEWHRIAQVVAEVGSAVKIIHGDWSGFEDPDALHLNAIATEGGAEKLLDDYGQLVSDQAAAGSQCLTVLDDGYPSNLRGIYNLPPFLFVRGSLVAADDQAIAVVGTRDASSGGIKQATRLAGALAEHDVSVLSGMAKGIDTAAHRSALAMGGRTVAVMGTGINGRYPAANRELASEIERDGALVSQFWPDGPPARHSFPLRNVVMSGMALGTVVIEASSTSGAKMQARLALDHGKLVFLVRSLVLQEDWAQLYADKRGAIVIDDVDDILARLVHLSRAHESDQLKLG